MNRQSESSQALQCDAPSTAADCDVLVIGGGPAGSTISSLLAEKGWHVVLLEKDRHPRFHIGESLLPMNMPILERLGVLEQVREIGIVKPGIEMCSDSHPAASQTYYFEKAMDLRYPYAFEVRRSEFDHLLLRNAEAKGARVREAVKVTAVEGFAEGAGCVMARDEEGRQHSWRARFLIDASGRSAFMATRHGPEAQEPQAQFGGYFRSFRECGAPWRPRRGQYRSLLVRAWLVLDDPLARRRHERRCGLLARLPEDPQRHSRRSSCGRQSAYVPVCASA